MAADVGGLIADVGLDVAELRKDVQKANKELASGTKRMNKSLGSVRKGVDKLTSGFKGLIAAVGVQQLGAAIGRTLSGFEDINRQARSLGASTETIQELTFAFRQFGLQQQDVTDAIASLTDRAQDAISGMESFQDDFAEVGISVEDLRGKKPAELFKTFAEAIANTENPNKRVTAAVRILGDEIGQKLMPMLMQGREGINRMADEAESLGAIFEQKLLDHGEQAAREFRKLREVVTAQFARVVANNAGELQELGTALGEVAEGAVKAAAEVNNAIKAIGFLFAQAIDPNLDKQIRNQQQKVDNLKASLDTFGMEVSDSINEFFGHDTIAERLKKEQDKLDALINKQRNIMNMQNMSAPSVDGGSGQQNAKNTGKQIGEALGEGVKEGAKKEIKGVEDVLGEIEQASLKRIYEHNGQEAGQAFKNGLQDFDPMGDFLRQVDKGSPIIKELEERAGRSFENIEDKGTSAFKELQNSIEGWSRSFADAVMSNEKGFSGFIDTVLSEIQRMAIAKATEPLFNALSRAFGNIFSGMFGGGGNPAANAVPDARASGGPVRSGKPYMVGEKGPEMFVPGANGTILPNGAGGGGDVTVNVINQGGSQVDVRDRGRRGGNRTIDVMVVDALSKAVESGRTDKMFKNAYGISRKGANRG